MVFHVAGGIHGSWTLKSRWAIVDLTASRTALSLVLVVGIAEATGWVLRCWEMAYQGYVTLYAKRAVREICVKRRD
jgi:hypothetical protein